MRANNRQEVRTYKYDGKASEKTKMKLLAVFYSLVRAHAEGVKYQKPSSLQDDVISVYFGEMLHACHCPTRKGIKRVRIRERVR